MSSYRSYERAVIATAALPQRLNAHWVKRLARRLAVPMPTARHWIYCGVPDCRLPEIASAILAECDEIEALIADTRRRWRGESNDAATDPEGGGIARQAGAPTRRLGRRGVSAMPPS